ncbi:hypothetical protein D9Q98_004309 [Chlorella vulgaris]|uniref:Uncharacterized protein n=1 Tax=Chlorella vulgaris TaxID=3077 RepID=A0A9D4TRR2_CHLVU|nr:hypothetical protein D9Q98_004309 [Chlorella vulgaris]
MLPFSRTETLSPAQADRVKRRCGVAAGTLQQCLAANPTNPDVCSSLETQVVHCQAEVVCMQLAADHQRCFKRVVNSQGTIPFSACDKEVAAMKQCLRRFKLYPYTSSSSSSGGGGSGGGSRRPAR